MGRIPWKRAAGEFAVIVVGVLVALWIEGWRENRQDRAAEEEYLQRLEEALVADSASIQARVEGARRNQALAATAMRWMSEGTVEGTDTATVLLTFHVGGFINFFRQDRVVWEELQATGNLRLLRDQELRRALGAYYSSMGFLEEFEDFLKEHGWSTYRHALHRHVSAQYVNRLTELNPQAVGGEVAMALPEDRPTVDMTALLADDEVRRSLDLVWSGTEVQVRQLRGVADQLSGALAEVRANRR